MGCRFDGAALKPAQFRPGSDAAGGALGGLCVSPPPHPPGTSVFPPTCGILSKSGPGDIVHSFSLFLYRGDSGTPGSSDVENNMPIYKWVLKILGEPI